MSEEKSQDKQGGGATAVAKPKDKKQQKVEKLPPYHVVLLNDDDHSYEYVMEMLKALFGHSECMGYCLAEQVDRMGRAVVFTGHKEKAELKRDQIHAYGADHRVATCKGSMSAVVVPAEEK